LIARIAPVVVYAHVVLAGFFACVGTARADEEPPPTRTHVGIAAVDGLRPALAALELDFEREHPDVDVVVVYGHAREIAARIADADAAIDALLADDEATMDDLTRAGRLDTTSRKVIVSNELVAAVPASVDAKDVDELKDLAVDDVRRIAVQPDDDAAGRLARRLLAQTVPGLEGKIVTLDNAAARTAAGEADAVVTLSSDVKAAGDRLRVIHRAGGDGDGFVRYVGAVVRTATEQRSARRFIGYMTSAAALDVFRARGYTALDVAH
jgi:molybdate transport system substrate-binding protein